MNKSDKKKLDMNESKSFRQPDLATPKNGWEEDPALTLPSPNGEGTSAQQDSDTKQNTSGQRGTNGASTHVVEADALETQFQYPTERRLFARKMDATALQDIQNLRALLSPEYNTLASYKDKLLDSPDVVNQFFLIHGEQMEVHPDLDSALLRGYTRYPTDLFFVGRISEKDINAYLST